jgi:uncharacterized protein (TIGR02611 family)
MTFKKIKRVIIAIVGTTVLLIGVVAIFLPAPAILIIPAGLGILATEFLWAKKLLNKFNEKIFRRGKIRKDKP